MLGVAGALRSRYPDDKKLRTVEQMAAASIYFRRIFFFNSFRSFFLKKLGLLDTRDVYRIKYVVLFALTFFRRTRVF